MIKMMQVLMEELGGADELIEFPQSNFTVSVFRNEAKLLFAPQAHNSMPESIVKLVELLKNNFRVDEIIEQEEGFEIKFDPRQNFQSVIEFLEYQVENDGAI